MAPVRAEHALVHIAERDNVCEALLVDNVPTLQCLKGGSVVEVRQTYAALNVVLDVAAAFAAAAAL